MSKKTSRIQVSVLMVALAFAMISGPVALAAPDRQAETVEAGARASLVSHVRALLLSFVPDLFAPDDERGEVTSFQAPETSSGGHNNDPNG